MSNATRLLRQVQLPLILLVFIWLVSVAAFGQPDLTYHLALRPRSEQNLWGLVTMAFVHQDWTHLFANSVPLALLLPLTSVRGPRYFLCSMLGCVTLTGLLLWCIGRDGLHIGASGLVFAVLGLLLSNAIFSKRLIDLIIAVMVGIFHWGLLSSVFSSDPTVSWEGHLSGLLAGVITSRVLAASRLAPFWQS